MKRILIGLIVVALSGCTNQTHKPITDAEKSAIMQEVFKILDTTVDAYNKIDLATVKSFFLDSPEFLSISANGTIQNLEEKINETTNFFENISSLQITILDKKANVLERDLVALTVLEHVEAILKTGNKFSFDKITVTEIYKKIENNWKVTFFQESALPPVIIKLPE